MSDSFGQETHGAAELLRTLDAPGAYEARSPRRSWLIPLVWGLAIVLLIGGVVWGSFQFFSEAASPDALTLFYTVEPGDLTITILEDGELASATNVDVKCEVAGGSTILWIVEDGAQVSKGDKLVELDSSLLEEQINEQKITYEKARAMMIEAEKGYRVAKIAVDEYIEGTYRQESQDLDATVTVAMENLRSSENAFEFTQRMFRKGYVSALERESQKFAVERARLELESAKTARDVLERFTKVKMVEDLKSQRDTAEAKMLSDRAAFQLEESRLKRLESQLEQCVIYAPGDGMVIYANERSRRSSTPTVQIEEGATVRERQTILRLPDLSQMQVKVTVHESNVDRIKRDMRATIRVQDDTWQGTVVSVANQPEPTSFFSAGVKEYATLVKIDGHPKGLRPGLTAEVEILIAHLENTLMLPVASVVEQDGEFRCWVKQNNRFERRPLVLGQGNDRFVAVVDGIAPGDQVVLNPRAVVAESRAESARTADDDVHGKFGTTPAPTGAPAADGQNSKSLGTDSRAGASRNPPEETQDQSAGPKPGAGPPGFRDLDKNQDGKVSRDEVPERMKPFFDRIDANGDGQIDTQELRAVRQRFEQRAGPR